MAVWYIRKEMNWERRVRKHNATDHPLLVLLNSCLLICTHVSIHIVIECWYMLYTCIPICIDVLYLILSYSIMVINKFEKCCSLFCYLSQRLLTLWLYIFSCRVFFNQLQPLITPSMNEENGVQVRIGFWKLFLLVLNHTPFQKVQ